MSVRVMMAAAMDQARAAFHKMFNSERYSRFTLQSEEDGGGHVEVKMSNGTLDETEAIEVTGQPGGSPSYRPHPRQQRRRNICYLAVATLLVFIIGYMVGYLTHSRPRLPAPGHVCPTSHSVVDVDDATDEEDSVSKIVQPPEPSLNWDDLIRLLEQRLTPETFSETLKDFDLENLMAGGEDDMRLGRKIYDGFKTLEMDPWTDTHYVQLQRSDSAKPNIVRIGSEVFQPKGYLAYSPQGTVHGKVVYGNYGRKDDLAVLQEKVDLKDSVVLLRAGAGRISFAQQVDNAAGLGAAAVLVYPDPLDYNYQNNTELYGHVHLGAGDPYTPGFPSFNHTQFPPTRSSGLPTIPAQTITAKMAATVLKMMGGPKSDATFRGGLNAVAYKLGGDVNVTVEVNNALVNTQIQNVFGIVPGFADPDRFVVLGAQRDAWGPGYARARVGTTILMELAKAVHEMVEKDGFRPRRSLVFASWSAGEYGSVGSTEWLEGYMASLDRRAFTYINLDGVVMGRGSFIASASPLLTSLVEDTMKQVNSPTGSGTLYSLSGGDKWTSNALRPMSMEDPSYPFLASSGIPSVSFHFISPDAEAYPYYGTLLDDMDHLNYQTNHRTSDIAALAGRFAGQMALRLVHDHLLRLDVSGYGRTITLAVVQLNNRIRELTKSGELQDVDASWLISARGSFNRAAAEIQRVADSIDLSDKEGCRIVNDRIMAVEHALLSPYVSPTETPFRHVLLGRGNHTLAAIAGTKDMDDLRRHLALATWTLKGCASAMAGSIRDIETIS